MRFSLLALACVVLPALACSPSSPTPEVGGQTGDPGVTEFESLDPGINPGSGGIPGAGSCSPAIQVVDEAPRNPRAEATLDDTHMVLFDHARGLAVLDTSGAVPRVISRLALPRSAGHLHVSGKVAFLSLRNVREWASYFGNGYPQIDDDAELIAVDLADPAAPRISARLPLAQAPRLSMLVASGGTTRLYVLSDGGAAYGCATFAEEELLSSYEWKDGRFESRATLLLGSGRNHSTVIPLGDKLAISRSEQDGLGKPDLSVISLAAPDGALIESAPLPEAGFPLAAFDGDNLRALSSDTGGHYLDVYDLSDPLAPKRQSRCPLGQVQWSSDRKGFAPQHVLLGGAQINQTNAVTTIAVRADGSCDVRTHRGRWRSMRWVGPPLSNRILDIDATAQGDVTVKLLDDADLRVISELTLKGAGIDAWFDEAPFRAAPDGRGLLLPMGVYETTPTVTSSPSLQLLRLVDDELTALGKVASVRELLPSATRAVLAWTKGKLARVDLTDLERPQLSQATDVYPYFSQVVPFETHWARLRSPHDDEYREEVTRDELFAPAQMASLELVPRDQDPDLADAVSAIEVNPFARFVRVGSLLVSIARVRLPAEVVVRPFAPPRRFDDAVAAWIEVFDLSDPLKPERVGELKLDALGLALPCDECTGSALAARDFVLENALILRARSASDELELRALDLTFPARPTLSDPLTRPETEPMISAFGDGTSVYYTYRVPEEKAATTPPSARFYFRRVDYSDPKNPQIGERVNVPGQLVALEGSKLYTREVGRSASSIDLGMRIHRLTWLGDKARLEVSHSVGERVAFGIELASSGRLLVDLSDPLENLLYGTRTPITPTDLRVLDGETLEQLGEGYIGPGATRLGVLGDHALYGAAQGVVLMNLATPAQPYGQAYVPTWGYDTGRGMIAGDGVVLEDSGALKSLALDFANLVRDP
jgi:hypothetical protein